METIRSNQYIEAAEKLGKDILQFSNTPENHPDLDQIRILQRRARVLKTIESKTGLTFTVVSEGAPKNAAAFVETSTERTFITESTLDDPNFATYAAAHEKSHLDTGIYSLDLKGNLKPEEIAALKEATGIGNLDDINLMEGFNDWVTGTKMGGVHEKSGYIHLEVPAARRLDQIALNHGKVSLKEAFREGDKELFFDRLRIVALAWRLKNPVN